MLALAVQGHSQAQGSVRVVRALGQHLLVQRLGLGRIPLAQGGPGRLQLRLGLRAHQLRRSGAGGRACRGCRLSGHLGGSAAPWLGRRCLGSLRTRLRLVGRWGYRSGLGHRICAIDPWCGGRLRRYRGRRDLCGGGCRQRGGYRHRRGGIHLSHGRHGCVSRGRARRLGRFGQRGRLHRRSHFALGAGGFGGGGWSHARGHQPRALLRHPVLPAQPGQHRQRHAGEQPPHHATPARALGLRWRRCADHGLRRLARRHGRLGWGRSRGRGGTSGHSGSRCRTRQGLRRSLGRRHRRCGFGGRGRLRGGLGSLGGGAGSGGLHRLGTLWRRGQRQLQPCGRGGRRWLRGGRLCGHRQHSSRIGGFQRQGLVLAALQGFEQEAHGRPPGRGSGSTGAGFMRSGMGRRASLRCGSKGW